MVLAQRAHGRAAELRGEYAQQLRGRRVGASGSGTATVNADAVIQLYGSDQLGAARSAGFARRRPTRSGYFLINGSGFGAQQGSGRVLVGSLAAIVAKWTDAQIVAYVPEAAPLGPNSVVVSTPAGDSNALQINVTAAPVRRPHTLADEIRRRLLRHTARGRARG